MNEEQPTLFEIDPQMRGVLRPGARKSYALAGKATITIRSPKTQVRFTYQIKKSKGENPVYYVALLSGPDNNSDYQYLGIIDPRVNHRFCLTRKSRVNWSTPSVLAIDFLAKYWELPLLEVWHEGSCGKCGRKLTVPESIETGLGPVCAGSAA